MIEDLSYFVNVFSGLAGVKDTQSKFLSMSKGALNLLGWKSTEECFGKSDYDIPCKASELADAFIKVDKIITNTGVKGVTLDIVEYSSGWSMMLTEKNILKNKNGNEPMGL